jgi:hypothetical protein
MSADMVDEATNNINRARLIVMAAALMTRLSALK